MHLGPMEIMLVLALALLFCGPARLPGLGNSLGSAIRDFKRAVNSVEDPDTSAPPSPRADGPEGPNPPRKSSAE
jgi:TatA/E family protein of Tat protein translocase